MLLLSECHVFVYEVMMMWWCCLSVVCLWRKWEWCVDVVEWVSCVSVWSETDVMMLLSECHVFAYKVRMMWWWCCCVSVVSLCQWSMDNVMMLLCEYHVFVYEMRMMRWCCWVSVMCLCMKLGWCEDVVEWVSCVCLWCEDDVMKLISDCHVFVYEVRLMMMLVSKSRVFVYEVRMMWLS